MNADQIIERIRGLRSQLDTLGVASLGLFGSVARGEERDDSDIDILVAFDGPATFDQYMDVKLLLEDALGRRVDLVTEQGLRQVTPVNRRTRTAPCRVTRGSICRTWAMPLTLLRHFASHEVLECHSRRMTS